VSGSNISVETGSEGPKHDPYAYTEVTVRRADGRRATIHLGLAEWMNYRDEHGVTRHFDDPYAVLRSKFAACVGITPERAERVHRSKRDRAVRQHPCGTRHLRWMDGFPGEHLLICDKCQAVLDSTFCEAEII